MVSLLYVTTKDKEEATTIAKTLLDERLIACANIIDGMESLYRWQDKIQNDIETVLLLKTDTTLVKDVIQRVGELHSDITPCIIEIPTGDSNKAYRQWVKESIR